ncbi:MAG TPA: SDR family NAD(P)-dependent oxidoreductase [Acidimicrobiales bacterium]
MRARRLDGSVVVLTGATSGAGRASAHAFARHHARLVLAARDAGALLEVVHECESLGAVAIAVPTDITDEVAIDRLATEAVARFGRIDTWVNAAAVLVIGELDQVPVHELDQLIATNVRGTMLAARAAVRQFRAQGDGVLIDVSSVLGTVPNPYVPAYTMSKFAVRGLTLALHHSSSQHAGIRACVVLPGPLDTPMFVRAANHTGRRPRSIPPACAPERAAAAIVRCARRPKRQVLVGNSARLIALGCRVMPGFTEWAVARYSGTLLLSREPADDTDGGLFGWDGTTSVEGGWRKLALRRRAGSALGTLLARR